MQFTPLDRTDEESVGSVMYMVDHVLQYGEDEEVHMPKDEDPEDPEDEEPEEHDDDDDGE